MKIKLFGSARLLKASYYNALLVIVKILSGVISSKVVAIFLGPSGLALLGNLKSFIKTVTSFTAEGYQNGTIRYISEHSENEDKKNQIYSTILQISLMFSLLIGLMLWGFSSTWSLYLFQTEKYNYVLKIIGVALPFWSYNLLIIFILNGLENYKKLLLTSSVLSIVNMLVSVILIIEYGLIGGLIGVVVGPVLVFMLNLAVLREERNILLNAFKPQNFSLFIVKDMSAYFLMTIYSTAIVSITVLLIRNMAIEKLSVDAAGYWEAMTRISNFYLMFFLSLTSFYLLPRLSKTSDIRVFKKEIKRFYLLSVPLLIVGLSVIYVLRTFILRLLLNESFLPTSDLFFWQLIGDFISVLAIALVKQFHAKRMVKAYLICNGALNVLYFTLSSFFIDFYGILGIVKAYALSYFIYLILVIIFVYSYFKSLNKNKSKHV